MKYRAIILFIVSCYALHAGAQELPLLGKLPDPGREWVLQKQGVSPQKQEPKKKGAFEYAWATFTNSKTGDIMSFAAHRYADMNQTVKAEAVHQSTTDTFSNGLPRFMPDQPPGWAVVTIRCNVITIGTGINNAARKNVEAEALEYSLVYEGEEHSARNLLGHGYVLAFGDTVIFVQHTSTRVITFVDAMDMAKCVLRNHPSSGLIQ